MPLATLAAALALFGGPGGGDFPVFVWRERYGGRAAPAELLAPFGGTNVEGAEEAEWARAAGLAYYVDHAPGRNDLHLDADAPAWSERAQRWYESRDPTLLVREPCLSEDATRARLLARLEASLAARGGEHSFGVSLGDEVGLTPNGCPSDVCRSEACEAAWRVFLAREGLAPAPAPTTDETRLALADGDARHLPLWLARRRFQREVVHGALAELAAATRARARGVSVGLMGLAGESAFGGVATERILELVDFVEPYDAGRAAALAFTVRRAEQRVLRTLFVGDATPDELAREAFAHWMRGGDGLVVWSDGRLEDHPAHAHALAEAVAEIRALASALPGFRPTPGGFALVHDARSLALCWLRDALLDGPTWPRRMPSWQEEHGTYERAQRAWLALLEDAGFQPGVLPLARVDADTLARFPVLVLANLCVLSDAELARIEAFLDAGGRAFVEGDLGWVDERGVRRAADIVERLRERAPGRVLAPPLEHLGYLERRGRSGDARGALTRASLRTLARAAGVDEPPFVRDGQVALTSWARVDGRCVCARLAAPGERAEVAPAAGHALFELRAADARGPLVFTLERVDDVAPR